MNKQIIFIPGLFALGILVGIAMMKSQQQDEPLAEPTQDRPLRAQAPSTGDDNELADDLIVLQTRIESLAERLEMLENSIQGKGAEMPQALREQSETLASTVDTPITARTRPLTSDSLVAAGVDAATAEDIVRRKSELELRKLELRDAAVRGGYLGTQRYGEQLQQLMDQEVSIREELGEDVYDRYLYNNGQSNRVRIASVMMGSAAEQSGFQEGDLIVSYDEQRLFDYQELQQATTEGDRNEYVSVTVDRDGEELILWVPRGPMGIRLTTTRIDPER